MTAQCVQARWRVWWLVTGVAVWVAACGGGVESGGTGNTVSSYSAGPITGFGSVVVNEVRFDDSTAEVEDADGTRRSRDELRLGMWVSVSADAITSANGVSSARASRIRFASDLLGPVANLSLLLGSFEILGQRVTVDDQTVFDPALPNGLADLAGRRDQVVEVFGAYDNATRRTRATRVRPVDVAVGYAVRGPVNGLDRAAQTLRVGDTLFSYAGASNVPADLALGQFVRLSVGLVAVGGPPPRFPVLAFRTALPAVPDADELRVRGLITRFASPSSFAIDGREVDASSAAFPDGTAALAEGVRVEIEGRALAGVLRATRVSLRSDQFVRERGFELRGNLQALDTANRRFELRGLVVNYARGDLRLEGGTLADLSNGRRVEVQAQLAPDRVRLEATRIKFE